MRKESDARIAAATAASGPNWQLLLRRLHTGWAMRMMLKRRCPKKLSVSASILPVFHKKRSYASFRPSSNQSTYIVFRRQSVLLEHLDTALPPPYLYISVLLDSLGHTHSYIPFPSSLSIYHTSFFPALPHLLALKMVYYT